MFDNAFVSNIWQANQPFFGGLMSEALIAYYQQTKDPRVIPTIVPRAYGSHQGEPSPVNAGTRYTPPESGTERASGSESAADSKIPRPSRSHWIAAPATNTLPSSA